MPSSFCLINFLRCLPTTDYLPLHSFLGIIVICSPFSDFMWSNVAVDSKLGNLDHTWLIQPLWISCALRHGVIAYFRLSLQDTLGASDQSTLLSSLETRFRAKSSPIRNSLTAWRIPRMHLCGLASIDSDGGCVALYCPIIQRH